MIRPEDAEKILTTHDLSVYLREIVQKEDYDLKIDIDYESGELFINCTGFSHGLSVTTDPFGVWVINEVISQENDGIFTQSGNLHRTEQTVTRVLGQSPVGYAILKKVPGHAEKIMDIFQ